MRLEWLEDILAVIETGSFSAAAERRFVTQPAFSRRIRVIEEHIGAELFDRERKPVVLKPLALNHQDDFRRLVADIRDLLVELRRQGREAHNRVVIASQHAITATLAPDLIGSLLGRIDMSVRLRSANRDECLALLMTKQADLLINYQTSAEASSDPGEFVERAILGEERLIPVIAPSRASVLGLARSGGEMPVIAYPSDAFLGRLFNEELLPRLPEGMFVLRKVETALSIAALELALSGIGVAWVPAGLARLAIGDGRLEDLSAALPWAPMTVAALRLRGERTEGEERLWSEVRSYGSGQPGAAPRHEDVGATDGRRPSPLAIAARPDRSDHAGRGG